ncbi:MAG: ATP-binding protein [Aquincola sp.]|nr:ATP-binding protein [Aquincola sp.]MDH5331122.1 ATP-binding protein [Aquincola sp.]
MRSLWPRSLFGRMVGVLAFGLVLSQVLSAWINWAERDRVLLEAAGMQPVQRVADVVRLLDSLDATERERIVRILNVPPLVVTLDREPMPEEAQDEAGMHLRMFAAMLRAALGDARPLRVAVRDDAPPAPRSVPPWAGDHARMMGLGAGLHGRAAAAGGIPLVTQVQLTDGRWVTFDTALPREAAGLPMRLLLTLTVLLLVVLALSSVAVRWLSRPLRTLAEAAEGLGKNIHQAPLAEDGPTEVRRAAQAFNTMQSRLARYIDDRTRVLAAISHDLKTPLTRLRLRAELLDDDDLRQRFERDLGEMQTMVTDALAALRGLDGPAQSVPVDMMALLESLQADQRELGREIDIEGGTTAPLTGDPLRMKRCIGNLLDNAVTHGRRAHVRVEDSAKALTLRIRDEGPGIPGDMLERVFDPFFRLEGSRSRETGGTGLGLSIARNIARAAGGDITIANRPEGGLEAVLTLPR